LSLTSTQGQCQNGSVGKEIKSWIDRHLSLVIGLSAGIGGFIVLLILCCCWRSYRRRSKQKKYAKKMAAVPPPTFRGGSNSGARGIPPPPPHMAQSGQGQWAPQPNHRPAPPQMPMQSPPLLYHRSSLRYA
jgi:hypothetical protein